jgi:hypothetical protein
MRTTPGKAVLASKAATREFQRLRAPAAALFSRATPDHDRTIRLAPLQVSPTPQRRRSFCNALSLELPGTSKSPKAATMAPPLSTACLIERGRRQLRRLFKTISFANFGAPPRKPPLQIPQPAPRPMGPIPNKSAPKSTQSEQG